jgi:hypothetical protein
MKRLLACCAFLAVPAMLAAQQGMTMHPAGGPPQSPAATATATVAGKTISIVYSAPAVRGREGKLFGPGGRISHDPTYPVWRAGANEATKLHTDADLTLGALTVPKGDYSLWVDVSDPNQWVLIVNKEVGQWGVKYDKAQDLGRVPMTMSKPPALIESLKYDLTALGTPAGKLTLCWEHFVATVPVAVH